MILHYSAVFLSTSSNWNDNTQGFARHAPDVIVGVMVSKEGVTMPPRKRKEST